MPKVTDTVKRLLAIEHGVAAVEGAVTGVESRVAAVEHEVNALNLKLELTNVRLEHLERLTEQVVQAIVGLRDDFRGVAAEVRELRLDHGRLDRLEARVERLVRDA